MLIKPRSSKNGLPNISSGIFENYVEKTTAVSVSTTSIEYITTKTVFWVWKPVNVIVRQIWTICSHGNKATNGENKLRVK